MKTGTLAGALAIGVAMAAAETWAAPTHESAFLIRGLMPRNQSEWEGGSGIEAAMRFWSDENFGFAFCVGMDSWVVKEEHSVEDDGEVYSATSVYGSTTVLPVGISALYRDKIVEHVSILMEAGVRYVLAGPGASVEMAYADESDSWYLKEEIETDDFVMGIFSIAFEAGVEEGIAVFCGLGLQFDLTDAHERFLGEDAGHTSFQAATFSLGCSWTF